MWIDAHCHLQFDAVGVAAVDSAVEAGVDHLVCVGTDADSSEQAFRISQQRPDRVSSTIGLHPHDAKNGLDSTERILQIALQENKELIVGIGECGLDYFYEHSARDIQKEVFAKQIELAKRHDLALVVHTRDAWNDTLEILRSEGAPPRTVIHCFTGGPEEARKCLDLGFYLSFSGVVTFKKATDVQAAAEMCPLDRMTIETDSPYLTPVPHRGKPNEPAFVGLIGKYLSELKKVQVDDLSKMVKESTKRLFNLRCD
jgi:TatD DNase family protein